MIRAASMILLITISVLTFTTRATAAPGDLDPAFGNGGVIFHPDVLYYSNVQRVVVQPGGKIVFAASDWFAGLAAFQRLNPNGSLDTSFGTNGILDLGESGVPPFAMLPNGKLLVCYDGTDIFLYSADGQFEGVLFQHLQGYIVSIDVYDDGKILVAGSTGTPAVATLTRRHPSGEPDQSFGTNGTVTISGEGRGVRAYRMPDGSYLVKTYPGFPNYSLIKVSADGQRDMTFGTGGRVILPSHEHDEIVAQPDGRFLTYDIPYPDPRLRAVVRRYHANGTLDSSFANNGELSIDTPVYFSQLTTGNWLAVKPNGKIVLAVRSSIGYRIMKLNSDGSPDIAFGSNGSVDVPVTPGIPTALNLVQRNKILVSGIGNDWGHMFVQLLDSGPPVFDFDGDGKTDIAIVRTASSMEWWVSRSSDQQAQATWFGAPTDLATPADFTGDGKSDLAVYRPSNGFWYVLRSDDFSFYAFPFGTIGDTPAPADFDGDGKADPTVFRPSNGTWYRLLSGGGYLESQFGQAGDKPVAADYDGDAKADIAVFRPTDGSWWVARSTAGLMVMIFGVGTDKTVPGDYTGDAKADIAVWRPSNGTWYVLRSEDLSFFAFAWGLEGDVPAPGDYDGDGRWDASIFRPSNGTWFINRTSGTPLITAFGVNGDRPIPNAFIQ